MEPTTSDTGVNSSEGVSTVACDSDSQQNVEQTLVNKRSWLTAFTWRKAQESEGKSEPLLVRNDPPQEHSKLNPPADRPQLVDTIVPVAQTKQDLSPPDSTSQPRDATLSKPEPEAPKDNVSTSPKPQSSPLDTLQSTNKSESTASLPATSTRFTLGIPLLGRPKPPLDRAASDSQREVPGSVLKAQSESCLKESGDQGEITPTPKLFVCST